MLFPSVSSHSFWSLPFRICTILRRQSSSTWRRRDRRRRVAARRQWHLHKKGEICLSVTSLARVRNIFLKHHSQDSAFISRITTTINSRMATEEAYPWICPCGRLNKKSANLCVVCWGHGTQGVKHDVTPKQKTYGGGAQWSESWEDWENSWGKWKDSPNWDDWDGAESTGRASSHSPRARHSPRSRQAKGKGKGKWKGKGKTKGELAFSPFGSGKGAMPSLPPWPAWETPEIGASPFQTAQSGKGSTMQEMAIHLRLRQAYKEKETPSDVQAFLDKQRRSTAATTSNRCMLRQKAWIMPKKH